MHILTQTKNIFGRLNFTAYIDRRFEKKAWKRNTSLTKSGQVNEKEILVET